MGPERPLLGLVQARRDQHAPPDPPGAPSRAGDGAGRANSEARRAAAARPGPRSSISGAGAAAPLHHLARSRSTSAGLAVAEEGERHVQRLRPHRPQRRIDQLRARPTPSIPVAHRLGQVEGDEQPRSRALIARLPRGQRYGADARGSTPLRDMSVSWRRIRLRAALRRRRAGSRSRCIADQGRAFADVGAAAGDDRIAGDRWSRRRAAR